MGPKDQKTAEFAVQYLAGRFQAKDRIQIYVAAREITDESNKIGLKIHHPRIGLEHIQEAIVSGLQSVGIRCEYLPTNPRVFRLGS